MFKLIILAVSCIYVATALGETEGLKCFHCYDSFNDALGLRSSENNIYGERFERCDKNKLKWNTWSCPAHYTVCVIMSGRVKNHVEIIRSCGKRDICKTYRPPSGVTLETCRECNSTLCNEYLELPTPTNPPHGPPNPPHGPTNPPHGPTNPPPGPTNPPHGPTNPPPGPTNPPLGPPNPPPVKPKFVLKFNVNMNVTAEKHPRTDKKFLK